MGITWREAAILASGIGLGAVASALVVLGLHRPSVPGQTQVTAAQRVTAAVHPRAACPQQPAATPDGAADGRFHMPAGLSSYGPSDTGAFMAVGKQAAAAGRPHDAEIAFLMACRVADQFEGADSAESARARDQLAVHYDDLLRESGPAAAANRGELLRRAQMLRPGGAAPAPEPPLQVAAEIPKPEVRKPAVAPPQGVKSPVIQPRAVPAPSPKPPLADAPPARAQPRRVELAKAAPRVQPQAVAAPSTRPSFDCARARSVSEKMICSDARLAQLDRELGQLHARAKVSARNAWAFNRRDEEEWRRREATCRDRECLLRWYAQRRHQLMNEIESG